MMVLIGRPGDLPEPLGMSLHLRHGAMEERVAAPGQKVLVVWEKTDKNTDKMAVQSEEREGDGAEVVEKVGCGGRI